MSRLDAKWNNFTERGQTWDHFWQDSDVTENVEFAQAAAHIVVTDITVFAQSQAQIILVVPVFAQSQADISQTYQGYANTQADISQTYQGYGQAQGYLPSIGGVETQVFAQAQAWICWTDDYTRVNAYGLGSDYTWKEYDTAYAVAADSTYQVDGSKVITSPDNADWDSYQINRPVPVNGFAQFDFTTGSSFTIAYSYMAIVFGEDYNTGGQSFGIYEGNGGTWYLTPNWNENSSASDLIVTINVDTTYTIKYNYQDDGKFALKIWETSDIEPNAMIFGTTNNFIPKTVAWLDFYFSDNIVSFDNLLFCNEAFPENPVKTQFGQATALIDSPKKLQWATTNAQIISFGVKKYGQAQSHITNFTPSGMARAKIEWLPISAIVPFKDTFTRVNNYGIGSPYWLWSSLFNHWTNPYEVNTSVDGSQILVGQGGDFFNWDAYLLQLLDPFPNAYQVEVEVQFNGTAGTTQALAIIPWSNTIYGQVQIGYAPDSVGLFSGNLNSTQIFAGAVDLSYHYRLVAKIVGNRVETQLWRVETGVLLGTTNNTAPPPAVGLQGAVPNDTLYFAFYNYQNALPWSIDNFAFYPNFRAVGQTQAQIKQTYQKYSQAQALITSPIKNQWGQAQSLIDSPIKNNVGQAQAQIGTLHTYNSIGQAQGFIDRSIRFGQAQAFIDRTIKYAQAQALICWTDAFTRNVSVGLGSDYTWQDWDGYDTAETSPVSVDGSKFVIQHDTFDSYSLNRTVPREGFVQFDFLVPLIPNQFHSTVSNFRGPGYGINFGANFINNQRQLYVGTATRPSGNNSWIIGSIDEYLRLNGWGVLFYPEEDTWYTAKMVYNDKGNVAYKVWKTSDSEPSDYLFYDEVLNFVSTNTAWLDIWEAPVNVSGYLDNLIFCYTTLPFSPSSGQAQALINSIHKNKSGNAQAKIKAFDVSKSGQAQALIGVHFVFAQAQALLGDRLNEGYAQAQAIISRVVRVRGNAQAYIYIHRWVWGQAQAYINPHVGLGQTNAYIISFNTYKWGQVQAYIQRTIGYGQAQTQILVTSNKCAQAAAQIGRGIWCAQAQAFILGYKVRPAQAQARITQAAQRFTGQSQGYIRYFQRPTNYAQAQAQIKGYSNKNGQAQARISRTIGYGNAQAFILQTQAGNLVRYNGYLLPGYLQSEEISDGMRINISGSIYEESYNEYIGLENKILSLRLKVVQATYQAAKEKVLLAGSLVRTNRNDWVKLTVIDTTKYYLAKTKSIKMAQQVSTAERMIDYDLEFECKPWKYGDYHSLIGTTLLDTDSVSRNIGNGTWTPAILILTGTDITVSGYTESSEFTGFISVSGVVNNLQIDTENYINNEPQRMNADYKLMIGPGRTLFVINGATNAEIIYQDRWSL